MKTRKQKQQEYEQKYKNIPLDYKERLDYMCDIYNISEKKMEEILQVRSATINHLYYKDVKVVVLLEEPEGKKRPRYTLSRFNYNQIAKASNFIRVYSPDAISDSKYLKELVDEELDGLNQFIYTPCIVEFHAYIKTPSSYSVTEKFIAEMGLDRPPVKPDWDNIGKKYSDMYNSNVWLDDSLVIKGVVEKYYSILPRVEIKIRYLNCVYNKKQFNSIIKRLDKNMPLNYLNSKGELINGQL